MVTKIHKPASAALPEVSFEIHTLEEVSKGKTALQIKRHLQSGFEIIWVVEGGGFHSVDNQEYQLSASSIYVVCPGQEHQLVLMPGTRGFVLSFTNDFLLQVDEGGRNWHHSQLLREFLQTPELTVRTETAEDLQDIGALMLKERRKYSLMRAEVLSIYLKIFIISYRRELPGDNSCNVKKTANSLVNDFFSELENNFKARRTVGHYAKALSVTPNYLNHLIKRNTGFSARHHIQQRILIAAKTAVRKQSRMKEIAFQLGFDDVAHFSKFFKNVSGLNFTEYRKRFNEQYAFA